MYYRYNFTPRNRYRFSYQESVHMSPSSTQSQEELARWEKVREKEAKRREAGRRAAQFFAEQALKEAQDRQSRRKFTVNPAAEGLSNESVHSGGDNDEISNGPELVWWGGAKPNGDGDSDDVLEPEGDGGTGNDSAGEAEADSAANAEVEIGLGSEYGNEYENGNNTTSGAEPDPHIDAHVDADLKADVHYQSKMEPVVVEINTANTEAILDNTKTGKFAATAEDTIPNPDTDRDVGSQIDQEMDAAAETTFEDNSPLDMAKFRRSLEEHMSLPARWTSGALSPLSSEAQFDEDANSTVNAHDDSAESIYYDFSDAAQSQSDDLESETYHDIPTNSDSETISNSSINDEFPVHLPDIPEFSAESVYPYLAPFVPFFTAKLANKNSQYNRQDFQAELRGMVLETYCGWLESLRVTVPGAEERRVSSVPQDCRHLGYWKKELGHEECEVCNIWRPIYMLVCSDCGIKKCVRCKFEEGK